MWLREEQRLKTAPWAILAFGILGAFLLFYRPPKPEGLPVFRDFDAPVTAPKHARDEGLLVELLAAAEAEDPPPADLPLIRRITRLLVEVHEGGLFQFFYTEAGNDTAATLADLRTIGADKTAAILQDACERFTKGKPHRELVLRRRQLERMDAEGPELADLDRRFLLREESLAELLVRHRAAK